jgi:HSP20 family protein
MYNKVCVPRQMNGVPMIFDRLMEEMNGFEKSVYPLVNISHGDQGYWLELAIPGVPKDEVKIELEGAQLQLSYDAVNRKEQDGFRFTKKEFAIRSFSRKFTLPDHVDQAMIKAQFENGVLRVFLPKKEAATNDKKQVIPIQ